MRQATLLRRARAALLAGTALLTVAGASSVARAQQDLSWDANGGTAGTGGTGTWNTTSALWFNGATLQSWNNATLDNAIFAGSAGTVTLAVPISAHNLTFNVGGYALTGNTLTFGGATPTVTTNVAVTTINSALSGGTGFTKAGTATLALGGDSTGYTGVTTLNAGSLRVNSANALGLSTAASGLVLNNGATLIFGANFTHNYTLTGGTVNVQGAGVFTLSGSPTLTASTILNFNGTLTNTTLSGNLADTGGNVLSLTKNGTGRTVLTGTNSYTGATTVTQGRIQLGSAGALSAGSNLVFNGATGTGGTIDLTTASGNFTRSLGAGAGQVQWLGDGGFQASGTSHVVNIGGAGATLAWGSGGFVPTGSRLILGTDSNSTLDFQNGIDLSGGTRAVEGDGGNISGHARISGVLSGTGGLDKVGNGILQLTGANTYSGGTTMTSGTLMVASDGNLGAAAGALTFNGGTLLNTGAFTTARNVTINAGGGTLQTNANLVVSGAITGAGGLSKTGAPVLTLTGTNLYAGGTTIGAGTLQIGNGGTAGSIVGNVLNNGALVFNRSDAITFGGAISGTGAVGQNGGGTTTLTAANSYTGGTTIGAGTLQIGNGGATGSIVGNVANNGVLAFNRSDAVTFGGVVSGAGALVQNGGGTLTLTGVNSYAGGTAVNNGTVSVAADTNLGASAGPLWLDRGTLQNTAAFATARMVTIGAGGGVFQTNNNLVLNGTISGSGALTKQGNAALTLTGAGTYAGGTTIAAGTLQLGNGGASGSIIGNVINNGALVFNRSDAVTFAGVISGTGALAQVGDGTLTLTGANTYSGGTAITGGTVSVAADTNLGAASGPLVLNGGTLRTTAAFATARAITLGAAGGAFQTDAALLISSDIGGAGALTKLGANALTLTGANTYAGGTAITAGALEIGNGGVTGSIIGTDVPSIQRALDLLTGEVYASSKGALIENSRFLRDAAIDRARQMSGGASSGKVAGVAVQEDSAASGAMWARSFGSYGHRDGDGNAARVGTTIGGVFAGFDAPVTDRLRLGLAAGYSKSAFTVNDRVSSASSDDFHLAVYGSAKFGPLGLRFGSAITWHSIAADRSIAFAGYSDATNADYTSRTAQAFGEAGYEFDFGRLVLEPYAQLAHVYLGTDSFTESGGAAALRGAEGADNVTYSTLGLHVSQVLPFPGAGVATARVTVGWRHAIGDLLPVSTLGPSIAANFNIAGVPIAKDALVVDAGIDFSVDKAVSLGIAYNGQIASGANDHGLRADLTWRY